MSHLSLVKKKGGGGIRVNFFILSFYLTLSFKVQNKYWFHAHIEKCYYILFLSFDESIELRIFVVDYHINCMFMIQANVILDVAFATLFTTPWYILTTTFGL